MQSVLSLELVRTEGIYTKLVQNKIGNYRFINRPRLTKRQRQKKIIMESSASQDEMEMESSATQDEMEMESSASQDEMESLSCKD